MLISYNWIFYSWRIAVYQRCITCVLGERLYTWTLFIIVQKKLVFSRCAHTMLTKIFGVLVGILVWICIYFNKYLRAHTHTHTQTVQLCLPFPYIHITLEFFLISSMYKYVQWVYCHVSIAIHSRIKSIPFVVVEWIELLFIYSFKCSWEMKARKKYHQ